MVDAPGEREPLRRREATVVSPLRYPGGKRRLAGYIAEALRLNGLRPKLFVEPFAGGANVALQLLNDGLVESVALGERDPLVASFWKVVFEDTAWLIKQIKEIRPSLELWEEYRRAQPETVRERALKCLFLNRTSFSGILNDSAGPIGGRSQSSAYSIDCRFAAETVTKRIRRIARLANQVCFIHEGDWTESIAQAQRRGYAPDDLFFYFDPPFYAKADRLYRYCFAWEDHQRLHDSLGHLNAHYIVSYDPARPIQELYAKNGIGPKQVELLYSATKPGTLVKAKELLVTSLTQLPDQTRLWRTSQEWNQSSNGSS